jgi:Tfp pilus assembly protein PilF
MTPSQLLLLALPSLAMWGVILWQRGRSQGGRVVLAFVGAVAIYSVLRAGSIGTVMADIDGERPYLMRDPLLPLGASSPQEIVGWGVALGLAWALAERAVAVFGSRAGPARISLLAFVAMASISAAVEGAAIAAGWWRWTLPSGSGVSAWSVPGIALLDWAFVAIDLLFPFLIWHAGRPLWQRLLALCLFPLHFLSHALVAPLLPGLPLTGHAIGHIVIVAVLAAMALEERGDLRPPHLRESRWWLTPTLALCLASWTAGVVLWHGHAPATTSLPLALLALALLLSEGMRTVASPPAPRAALGRRALAWRRGALFAALVAAATFWLWPAAARDRELQAQIDIAVAAFARGNLQQADAALMRAQQVSPRHPAVFTLKGFIALRNSQLVDAQAELDQALRVNPNSRTALQLAAVTALRQHDASRAHLLARRGRDLYPDDLALRYLESASAGINARATLIALASHRPEALAELAAIAQLAGDRAMLTAAQDAMQSAGAVPNAAAPDDF